MVAADTVAPSNSPVCNLIKTTKPFAVSNASACAVTSYIGTKFLCHILFVYIYILLGCCNGSISSWIVSQNTLLSRYYVYMDDTGVHIDIMDYTIITFEIQYKLSRPSFGSGSNTTCIIDPVNENKWLITTKLTPGFQTFKKMHFDITLKTMGVTSPDIGLQQHDLSNDGIHFWWIIESLLVNMDLTNSVVEKWLYLRSGLPHLRMLRCI